MTDSQSDFVPRSLDDLPPNFPAPVSPDEARVLTPEELLSATQAAIVPLVTQYRIHQSNKKIADANLDGLKGDLKPLLATLSELTQDSYHDERGFAKIVQPEKPDYFFISDDNAATLQRLASGWAVSDNPALMQAGVTTLQMIEAKTRGTYVLVK